MRLSTPSHQRFRQARQLEVEYGGGESNVAVSLANYGRDVSFVSRLPDNDLGDCAIRSLQGGGHRHVPHREGREAVRYLPSRDRVHTAAVAGHLRP